MKILRMKEQINSGSQVTIGRPKKTYHPPEVEAKIRDIVGRYELLNLSAKRIG